MFRDSVGSHGKGCRLKPSDVQVRKPCEARRDKNQTQPTSIWRSLKCSFWKSRCQAATRASNPAELRCCHCRMTAVAVAPGRLAVEPGRKESALAVVSWTLVLRACLQNPSSASLEATALQGVGHGSSRPHSPRSFRSCGPLASPSAGHVRVCVACLKH